VQAEENVTSKFNVEQHITLRDEGGKKTKMLNTHSHFRTV